MAAADYRALQLAIGANGRTCSQARSPGSAQGSGQDERPAEPGLGEVPFVLGRDAVGWTTPNCATSSAAVLPVLDSMGPPRWRGPRGAHAQKHRFEESHLLPCHTTLPSGVS